MPSVPTVLIYDYVRDIAERRVSYREAHLALLDEATRAGELVAAGALGDPITGALFVFRTREAATRYLEADPYGDAGLVVRHRLMPWTVVAGEGMLTPPALG